MKVIINNIIRTIKGHPKENFLILFNMIICTMTVFVLIQNFYFLKNHFDDVYGNDQIAKHYSIQMKEEEYRSMLTDLLNHSPMYYVGQKVNREIMNTPHLSLYYFSMSDIELSCFKDRERFERFSYLDEGAMRYYQSIGEDADCRYIRSMIVTDNADIVFNLSLLKGRFFDNNDRNTNDPNKPVPVILGNDYADSFKVGDVIELNGDKAVVIGILEDNMYMSASGTVEYLDNQIMTLCLFPRDFEVNTDSYDYQKTEIYDCIYCDDANVDVQKEINKITAINGYYTYEVQPIDGVEISETKDVSAKNVALIGLLALIACIICTFSLSSVLYNRTVHDRDIFCIYLCCGIPLWKINISLIIEMAIYLFISFFPTYALSIMEFRQLLVQPWQILLFSGILVTVSLFPIIKINKENNLDLLIRNRIV